MNVQQTSPEQLLDRLQASGYAIIEGVAGPAKFLSIAGSLGDPVANRRGEIVQRLQPTPAWAARANTLSRKHGFGEFPLHTDTAFWTVPARYLVLRCSGDVRRTTTVTSMDEIFRNWGPDLVAAAKQSIWQIRDVREGFLCGLRFNFKGESGWRFDADCMHPRNKAAITVSAAMASSLATTAIHQIYWAHGTVAVIANWHALHGRGPAPAGEGRRVLERIYVR